MLTIEQLSRLLEGKTISGVYEEDVGSPLPYEDDLLPLTVEIVFTDGTSLQIYTQTSEQGNPYTTVEVCNDREKEVTMYEFGGF